MIEPTRRRVVLSGAAAFAVFGIARPIEIVTGAVAADTGFHRFKVGDVEVTTLYDGVWERDHDAGFIANASVEETKAALKASGLSGDKVPIPFTVTFIRVGGQTIMFDAGTGGQLAPTAGKLDQAMAAAGIDPKTIGKIVITHFHPDHIFGLMEKETNAQIYPNAEILVPAAELSWWTGAEAMAKMPPQRQGMLKRIQSTLGKWKNVTPVENDQEIAPGILAVEAPGHTPGHTAYRVTSEASQLLVLGDTSNIPALFVRHPEWHVVFDMDAKQAEVNRRALFERAIAENAIVTGYHYGLPGAGRLEKDGAGYVFTPVA
jgi:glyoxylase-like metal-dependent hydrolase (beta-lactamase superfamily II)